MNKGLNAGIYILAGIWLFIAPFIFGYFDVVRTNDMILGVIIFVLGLIRAFTEYESSTWTGWISILAGIWLFIAPFALGYFGSPINMWNDIILGVIVVGASLWGTSSITTTHRPKAAM